MTHIYFEKHDDSSYVPRKIGVEFAWFLAALYAQKLYGWWLIDDSCSILSNMMTHDAVFGNVAISIVLGEYTTYIEPRASCDWWRHKGGKCDKKFYGVVG
jgi:hypothetical protein